MSDRTELYNYLKIKELETLCEMLGTKIDCTGDISKFLIDINDDRHSFLTAEGAVHFLKGIQSERSLKRKKKRK